MNSPDSEPGVPSEGKPSSVEDIFDLWLKVQQTIVGKHSLLLLTENDGAREGLLDKLRDMVRSHYVAPNLTMKRLADLGAPETAELLREHLPTTETARSGDLGEVLATEVAERYLAYKVPIRRLRWKDGRNMPLRGDDIVAVKRGPTERLQFLKGESKSRKRLTTPVINEAAAALDRDQGLPTRHSVLIVAERLRDQDKDDLAKELEEAVLASFRAYRVEHLLFTLTGNNPEHFFSNHLKACNKKDSRRHTVGIRINDHSEFIEKLFLGM